MKLKLLISERYKGSIRKAIVAWKERINLAAARNRLSSIGLVGEQPSDAPCRCFGCIDLTANTAIFNAKITAAEREPIS
jgi:hypothetical protein